jgi:hypothetical protein
MDPVAIASYIVQSQASQTQLTLITSLVNEQQNASSQLVSMIETGAQANGASDGTGHFLNTYA